MTGPSWDDLPSPVHLAIRAELESEVTAAKPLPTSGVTAKVLARLEIADAPPVVLKAGRSDIESGTQVRRERQIRGHHPSLPAPGVRFSLSVAGWDLLGTTYTNDHFRPAVLTPGSRHLASVLEMLAMLDPLSTAAAPPAGAPLVEDDLKPMIANAWAMLDGGTLSPSDKRICGAALDGFDTAAAAGASLLHGPWEPRDILVDEHREYVRFLDWGDACYGAAWAGLVPFGLMLMQAGHTATTAEEALAKSVLSWREAPYEAATGLVVAWTLNHMHRALQPPWLTDASGMKQTGLSWLRHRLRSSA